MRSASHGLRAIVLIEMLAVVSVGTVLASIAFVTLKQTIDLHRAAARNLDRQATVAALTRQLRKDAAAASTWSWDNATLMLTTVQHAGRTFVEYRIGPDQITRTADGAETHVWRAPRLRFSAQVQAGQLASVLVVEIERPQAAAAQPASLPFLLPAGGGAGL
jgi:type II secretory pathway component PulJ